MKTLKLLLIAIATLLFTSCAMSQYQLPLQNSLDSINRWDVIFSKCDSVGDFMEKTDQDTMVISWIQYLVINKDTVETFIPDSVGMVVIPVYVSEALQDTAGHDTVLVDHAVYTITLVPGNYYLSVRTYTVKGEKSLYSDPFTFTIKPLPNYPPTRAVQLKVIFKIP